MAVMTGSHHERASDRYAEAMEVLEREKGWRYDIVVMVQGDEPMTHPEMISEAIQPLIKDQTVLVSNL
jgi:3-deoxy-manno-octulosonate cytidylyltransferase (CMP-KDO synthetase)